MNHLVKYRLLVLLICFFVSAHCFGAQLEIVEEVKKSLNVEIITDTTFHGTWSVVAYEKTEDTARFENYLSMLLFEFSKYPSGYLHNARVDKIIICDNLFYGDQNRAAVPDPYMDALYLACDSKYSENYLIHVMHHELNHSTEYALYRDMYYKWKKWTQNNSKDFTYGNGGASAYEEGNREINWYGLSHPAEGFVNLYSTTGQEEDRSEIVALIMNDNERHFLFEYCAIDRRLKSKVKLILTQMDKVTGTECNYWEEKMGDL